MDCIVELADEGYTTQLSLAPCEVGESYTNTKRHLQSNKIMSNYFLPRGERLND